MKAVLILISLLTFSLTSYCEEAANPEVSTPITAQPTEPLVTQAPPVAAIPQPPAPAIKDEEVKMREIVLNTSFGKIVAQGATIDFSASAQMNLMIAPGIQIGGIGMYSYATSTVGIVTGSVESLVVLAGPTINFPMKENVDNTFFITAAAGLGSAVLKTETALATTRSEKNYAVVGGEVGGRIKLIGGLLLRPSISVIKPLVTGLDSIVTISPAAFAFSF